MSNSIRSLVWREMSSGWPWAQTGVSAFGLLIGRRINVSCLIGWRSQHPAHQRWLTHWKFIKHINLPWTCSYIMYFVLLSCSDHYYYGWKVLRSNVWYNFVFLIRMFLHYHPVWPRSAPVREEWWFIPATLWKRRSSFTVFTKNRYSNTDGLT